MLSDWLARLTLLQPRKCCTHTWKHQRFFVGKRNYVVFVIFMATTPLKTKISPTLLEYLSLQNLKRDV